MKKTFLTICLLALTLGATAQEVTIKKGKATMSEADYKALVQKAEQVDRLQAELATVRTQLEAAEASQRAVLTTFEDSASYAIGQDVANGWAQQNLGINARVAGQAMIDVVNGSYKWNSNTSRSLLQRFQQNFERREKERQNAMMAGKDQNIADGKDFLAKNANNKSVYTTKSGLQYRKVKEGNGKKPKPGSKVKVHYTGKLIDGKKFDSSYDRNQPIEITVGVGQVIPGWDEGIQLMDEGSKYVLFIPYNLGYGEQPVGDIPPGSTLVFEVELLEVK